MHRANVFRFRFLIENRLTFFFTGNVRAKHKVRNRLRKKEQKLFVNLHKKVLLREHTARRVASAGYADLSADGRGYSIQSWTGVPIQSWMGVPRSAGWGTPLSGPGMGVPPGQQDGIPPIWTWDRVPPSAGWVYPLIQTWDGVPPYSDLGWATPPIWTWDGVPPLPQKCGQSENIVFHHPLDAGSKYHSYFEFRHQSHLF